MAKEGLSCSRGSGGSLTCCAAPPCPPFPPAYQITHRLNATTASTATVEVLPPSARQYTATGLKPESVYLFRITAQTRKGWGEAAEALVVTTEKRGDYPQGLGRPAGLPRGPQPRGSDHLLADSSDRLVRSQSHRPGLGCKVGSHPDRHGQWGLTSASGAELGVPLHAACSAPAPGRDHVHLGGGWAAAWGPAAWCWCPTQHGVPQKQA